MLTGILIPLIAAIGPWALAVIAVVVFAESGVLAGFFLPGDSLLFASGVLIAAGVIQVPLAVAIGTFALAAFVGDQVGFIIGRRFGPKVLTRPQSRFLTPKHISRAQAFFQTYGPKAVILARFVPFARTFTPVIAGVGRMPRGRFTRYNAAGAFGWTLVMVLAGSFLGGIPLVAGHIELITMALVALSVAPAIATIWRSRHRNGSTEPKDDLVAERPLEHAGL